VDLGLFGGWSNMVAALIEAVGFYFYAILLLRLAGKTIVGLGLRRRGLRAATRGGRGIGTRRR
jgi:hypothetical protein